MSKLCLVYSASDSAYASLKNIVRFKSHLTRFQYVSLLQLVEGNSLNNILYDSFSNTEFSILDLINDSSTGEFIYK